MKQPRLEEGALAILGSEQRVGARYRCAKGTECSGMGDQGSEHLVVPLKRGNAPERTPWREGDAGTWTRWRDR